MVHLPMKFGAYIFIQSGVRYFSKIKDGGRRHIGFVWVSDGITHEASFVARSSYEPLFSFQVIRIWFFSRSGLKVLYSRPQFGQFYPQSLGVHRSDPQKSLPWKERRVLRPHWSIGRTVRPVALAKKPKKKEKRQRQTGYLPRPPTSPYREVNVCIPGGLRCVVL